MKLTDILRQINEEEEQDANPNSSQPNYEIAIIPSDMQAALDALSNSENYVVKVKDKKGNEKIDTDFSRSLSNQSQIDKIFGRSKMAEKNIDAMNDWNSLSPVGRRSKVKDLQKREPETYKKGIEQKDFVKAYNEWQSEGNEGSIEDFIVTNDYKPGAEFAPIKKVSKLGTDNKYFPQKNAATLKKYAGTLSMGTHYDIDGDKIVFPFEKNKSWVSTKSLLGRRVETIMDNAGVAFDKDTKYELSSTTPTQEPTPSLEPKPSVATFKITLDPKKIRGNTDAVKNMIAGLKNTYDKNFDYSKNVLTITNIKPEKKIDLIKFFAPYKQTELTEGLDFDFEKYQMLRRAGIIK